MEQKESKEEVFKRARARHIMLDTRLRHLLDKSYLTEEEEVEIRDIKKHKLFFKDIMETINVELRKGDLN